MRRARSPHPLRSRRPASILARGRAAAALAAVLALAAGCAPKPPPPAAALPAPLSARQILDSLAARRAAVHSLRAFARLSYSSPEDSHKAKQLIAAERPDRLRLEVFSPFGAVFVLAAGHGTLAAWVRDESTVYRGPASAANLYRYSGVDLPVETAVDIVFGTPPLADDPHSVVTAEPDGTVEIWQEDNNGSARAAWFSPALDLLRYERRDADGRVPLRATFADYAEVDGQRVATAIGIELPLDQRRLDLDLADVEVNPVLPDSLFVLDTPTGSREVEIDGAGPR